MRQVNTFAIARSKCVLLPLLCTAPDAQPLSLQVLRSDVLIARDARSLEEAKAVSRPSSCVMTNIGVSEHPLIRSVELGVLWMP